MLQYPKYLVPGIETKPFFSRDEVGLAISGMEFEKIATECLKLLKDRANLLGCEFPELSTTGSWKTIEIIRNGEERLNVADATPIFFRTCAKPAIELGFGSCFISVLNPGTRIAPHCGMSNVKLRCQIQITEYPAHLMVGNEAIYTKRGELVIFDDSIAHSVIYPNSNMTSRVCAAWDISHPAASTEAKAEICAAIRAERGSSFLG
jgi:hypothetical protein